ncbi:MAG: hypothetical protein CM1200mP2_14860 [Planctomycetaceae bacterium]|nr:MAG: hypothetical protein CM1200mP2_14860 [Planctomycetaceae bacterium]
MDGKVALTAPVSRELIDRGLNAGECVRAAAQVVEAEEGGGRTWPKPVARPRGRSTRHWKQEWRSIARPSPDGWH